MKKSTILPLATCLCLAFCALWVPHASPNAVLELGRWSPSETWDSIIRIQWDGVAAITTTAVLLLGMVVLTFFQAERGEHAPHPGGKTFFLCALFSLVLLCTAREVFLFTMAWALLGVSAFALAPRRSETDGISISLTRWLPPRLSEITLLVALIACHTLFKTSDLMSMAAVSREPYDYDPGLLLMTWCLVNLAGLFQVTTVLFCERESRLGSLSEVWWRSICIPIAVAILLARFGFLADLVPQAKSLSLLFGIPAVAAALRSFLSPEPRRAVSYLAAAGSSTLCAAAPLLGSAATWAGGIILSALSLLLFLSLDKRNVGPFTGAFGAAISSTWFAVVFTSEANGRWIYSTGAVLLFAAISLGLATSGFRLSLSFLASRHEPAHPDEDPVTNPVQTALLVLLGVIATSVLILIPTIGSTRDAWVFASFPWQSLENEVAASSLLWVWGATVVGMGIAWLFRRSGRWISLVGTLKHKPSRRLSATFRLGEKAKDRFETWDSSFWPQIWRIPVQACHTVGSVFLYWSTGGIQYTLFVVLVGTLLLLWGALKTQVMW